MLLSTLSLTAFAAQKGKLTVTYKGKKITLMSVSDVNDFESKSSITSLSKVKKAWGKPNSSKKGANVFKKKKSSVTVVSLKGRTSVSLDVRDKNMTVCGVKVGMKRADAVKKLQKAFGMEAVMDSKTDIQVAFGGQMPITFELKSGKVSAISFFAS